MNNTAYSEKTDIFFDKDALARKNFCAAMKNKNLSCAQLAAKLDISEKTVEKYHSGQIPIRNAAAKTVYDISQVLGIEIKYIIGEGSYEEMVTHMARTMSFGKLDTILSPKSDK